MNFQKKYKEIEEMLDDIEELRKNKLLPGVNYKRMKDETLLIFTFVIIPFMEAKHKRKMLQTEMLHTIILEYCDRHSLLK